MLVTFMAASARVSRRCRGYPEGGPRKGAMIGQILIRATRRPPAAARAPVPSPQPLLQQRSEGAERPGGHVRGLPEAAGAGVVDDAQDEHVAAGPQPRAEFDDLRL